MASNLKFSTALRNARGDAITAALGTSCKIELYDGTQPAGPGTAVSTQTKLVTLTGNASAFAAAASGGVVTANEITGANAVATGTTTWARLTTSGGAAVTDCSVGMSDSDLILSNTSIASGQAVSASSLTITEPS